jgi:DNA-directed RNA polymerase subunit RPC12/RpoP
MLEFKCRDCGKIFEAEDAWEGWFAEQPAKEEILNGHCKECTEIQLAKLAESYDPETDKDLEIECHTDGTEWN